MSTITQVVDNSNPAVSVGVQSWSRGAIFPAVITVREVYETPIPFDEFLGGAIFHATPVEFAQRLYQRYLTTFYSQPLERRLIARFFVLRYPGQDDITFQLYETAARVAQRLNDAAVRP